MARLSPAQRARVMRAGKESARLSRIDDYLHIGGDQMSGREAAERIGVSRRTVQRYRSWLRAQEQAPQEGAR